MKVTNMTQLVIQHYDWFTIAVTANQGDLVMSSTLHVTFVISTVL